jgi:hypothetical protein
MSFIFIVVLRTRKLLAPKDVAAVNAVFLIFNPLTAIVLYRRQKNNCLQRRYIVLPSDCDGVESRKTFVLYRRRGGQKVKRFFYR